jgi:replicative DNA helicase
MNIAEHATVDQGLPVAVFSLEMGRKELAFRMLCSRARVEQSRAENGTLSDDEMARIAKTRLEIAKAPLEIHDEMNDIDKIVCFARASARRGIRLIIIDYLQLLATKNANKNRYEAVTYISNTLKRAALECQIPFLVPAQLNRNVENEKRKPYLSDLRDSGSIEQDADFVGLLHGATEDDDGLLASLSLIVAKNRQGRAGMKVDFMFNKTFTRFLSAAKTENDDLK